jgi:hypothetical protein
MRSISNIIAVLGLLAIASIAVVIGYTIMMNYVSQSFKPTYDLSVSYAKLVYITSSENIYGTTYTTFKGEIGISNPGNPTTITICIVSARLGGSVAYYTPTTFTGSYSCPTVNVDSGYNVYSFIIRISNSDLDSIGCTTNRATCPLTYDWHYVVLDSQGRAIAIIKPVYVIP